MPQQNVVSRVLKFQGIAAHQPNVEGRMLSELKIFDEIFTADAEESDWIETTFGNTIDHSAVDGGATIITGDNTAANDCGELTHTAQWSAASNCGMEVKMKISQITDVAVCVGFVDQRENTDNQIPGELNSAAVLRDPTNTADAALFIFDTTATTKVWYVAAIDNNGIGTPVAAVGSIAPEADKYFRVRVQTDTLGNVTFYYNGKPVGYLGTAIGELSTELLTPAIGFLQRVKGAQICTVSRVTVWQDCS